jgi:hypothetical protein
MNIKISYSYKDAGGYKLYGYIVLLNDLELTIEEVAAQIDTHLIDEEFFDPRELSVPLLRFETHDPELDHDWHCFECIESTNEHPTDVRLLSDFIAGIKLNNKRIV